jgi:hypothetical protein
MNSIQELRDRLQTVRRAAADMDAILATAQRRAPGVCVMTVPQRERFIEAGNRLAAQLDNFMAVANRIPLIVGDRAN